MARDFEMLFDKQENAHYPQVYPVLYHLKVRREWKEHILFI